ncbi:Exodeoxyribonuclease VII small subunit [hydrothermal vent metagenome]|uniref:Exodeoxyribonuclease VII small subunit n=1 Tax=hydrothermal vent metagenome TaxID=652676 RepID=A0A3B1AFK4_9ZZZZ
MTETKIEDMNFEQALAELEKIVGSLEQGNVPLEQSIEIYGRGESLKKHCQTLLKSAEDKVEKIRLNSDGVAKGSEPLDRE